MNNYYHSIRAVKRSSALALLACVLFAGSGATAAVADQVSGPRHVEAEMLDGGGSYSLTARDAGITLISVWSPDSLSSRKSIGELERFAGAYASRGVYTLAASTLDDKDALRAFVAKRKLTVPVAVLGKHDLGKQDDLRLPLVYVFDAKGQLRATHVGLFSLSVLERMVVPLLAP